MLKKILLINPSSGDSRGINEATIYPPLGLAYLASYLREKAAVNSYDVKIVDANVLQMSNQELLNIIKESPPDIIGLHLNIILANNGIGLAKTLKREYPGILLYVGGPIVSSNPEEIIKLSSADAAVIGEGETTFLELCEGQKLETIKGIAYVKDNKVILTQSRPLIEDLDTIPIPAYELLPDFKKYKARARKIPVGAIMTSRGCPYQCTFCNSKVFGKKFRAHSPEYIAKVVDLLTSKYSVKQLDVLDDNFTLDADRAEKILDMIIARRYKIAINLQNGVRADSLNENLVQKMKKAGVFKAGIGIESADKNILKSIKKSLDLEKVLQAINWFKKYKIMTIGFFMMGFPNDTQKSINETIDFALTANPSIANFMILIPLPGTELYAQMKENNLLTSPDTFYYTTGFYETKLYHKCLYLTSQELTLLQKKAYSKFYFRISKIFEMLFDIRSGNELKWTLQAGWPILKNILFKKRFSIFRSVRFLP